MQLPYIKVIGTIRMHVLEAMHVHIHLFVKIVTEGISLTGMYKTYM